MRGRFTTASKTTIAVDRKEATVALKDALLRAI